MTELGVWAKLMGSSKNSRTPLAWEATLGGMVAIGAYVRRVCTARRCGLSDENVDIGAMLEAEGPQATLWNRRPVCPHCGDRGHYMASPAAGAIHRPLLSDPVWQAAKHQLLHSFGFSRRDVQRIKAFAERVKTSAPYARGLSDLDAEIYVTARKMSALPIPKPYELMGEWAARDLLYRRFNEAERGLWQRRRGGPRPV